MFPLIMLVIGIISSILYLIYKSNKKNKFYTKLFEVDNKPDSVLDSHLSRLLFT